MTTIDARPEYAVGSLVRARGREWVVLPESEPDFLLLRPLGGGTDDITGLHTALEVVEPATYPLPSPDDLGDARSAGLLRTALRLGFRSSAGPFRSLANLAVEPRAYQLVPLMMALREDTVRLLIADDVGIGKTIEAGLVAAELLATGQAQRLAVLCSPALAEQWQVELRDKFGIDAEVVLTSTVRQLERGLMTDQSLFDQHPFVVVSTDFIKSDRRRHEFLNHCPDLVIVDEAHTSVADGSAGSGRQRHQRYELLKGVAADADRHLILVTATPHSGKDEGFRNLIGLLDPALASVDLDSRAGRERLARHFVQRRRQDIRQYAAKSGFHEETRFPDDRETRDVAYLLTPAYQELMRQALEYAREQVKDHDLGGVRQRVRWWSMLALLRSLASSPAAAASTLRTRAAAVEAVDVEEADALGRAAVLDTGDDEVQESVDTIPGADTSAAGTAPSDHQRRRLRLLAEAADELCGVEHDAKLKRLITEVKGLLADGYDPIVFCRFIDTAEYVAEHLATHLGKGTDVAAVTGSLPPSERQQRIAELTATDARHVLVATDCLSEGVNLQDAFQAVVHYDLAWNPTRLEQREGRVDRFGQTRSVVRALTLYGQDNSIDGIVLDVLIRRHHEIRRATGVSVPVPAESDSVVEALIEGLLLRGLDGDQLTLDIDFSEAQDRLVREWTSSAEKEKVSRTKYAQGAIHPEVVAEEVARVRAALGHHAEIEPFIDEAMRAFNASVSVLPDGLEADTRAMEPGLRDLLPVSFQNSVTFKRDLPIRRREALLARTDRVVEAVARQVLDTALDTGEAGTRPARRSGVIRTSAVSARTTLLLVRYRFLLETGSRAGKRSLVVEDSEVLAFRGGETLPEFLPADEAHELLVARPERNVPADQARDFAARAISVTDALAAQLGERVAARAEELRQSHLRVREGSRAATSGLEVRPQTPVDVLGVYVYLPAVAAGGAA